MDSFEVNKVLGAVLGAALFAMGSGFLAELIYQPKPAGNAGYALPGAPEGGHGGEAKADAPKGESIATLLASADAEKGKGGTKACQACHSFEKGGPNKIGPDLWDVVERKKGGHEGFDYSAAMKEKGGTWTYEDLDHFLTKPGAFIKGTKMAFSGIGAPQERANVIAYLRSLSDSPKALPAAEKKEEGKKEEGKADAKKAEGEKKPEAKPAEKPADAKPADKKAEGEKKPDANPDAKPAEKPAEKPADAKAEGEKKPEEAKPAEKPADKADSDKKPSEEPAKAEPSAKPAPDAEKKAEDAKSGDAKSGDAKSGDAKSGDAKSGEQAAEPKPAEEKPAEEKPAEGK